MNRFRFDSLLVNSFVCLALSLTTAFAQTTPERVLIFSKTVTFRHKSIPAGQQAIMKLGQENNFLVDTTENAANFTETNLKRYKAIVFLSTTGNVLDETQQVALQNYIQAGGGFVGIHAASDTEHDWPWYGQLVGAYFINHPGMYVGENGKRSSNVQDGEAYAVDKKNASMFGFPDRWKIKDEFYNFSEFKSPVTVLVKLDEKTYIDGKMGDNHPMSWYHEFEKGKVFYTAFGHTDEMFSNPVFLKHLLGGIQYVKAAIK